jgi:2-desacetyl-2-hydroxyethyl bacteriochlorophyllide A dehydrogenase
MKALRFHGAGDLRLEELPIPDPGPGEARIRPQAVGVCGTDAHIFRGEFPAAVPVTLGHEIGGVVDAVGAAVQSLHAGDLVTIQPNTFCAACRFCRGGREHLCESMRAYGVHMNGGFAEAMTASARNVYRLPEGIGAGIGCFAEPLACCVHGMDRLAMRSGASVLVIGAGAVGLMLTRLARLAGAGHITVSEPNERRRTAAAEFGADRTAAPDAIEGEFDYAIDAVGSQSTFEQAVSRAARGGAILVFGAAPAHAAATVRPYDIFARELTIVGSLINPYTHTRAVELLPQMGLERLNVKAFPLARYREAFETQSLAAGATKVLFLPQE